MRMNILLVYVNFGKAQIILIRLIRTIILIVTEVVRRRGNKKYQLEPWLYQGPSKISTNVMNSNQELSWFLWRES